MTDTESGARSKGEKNESSNNQGGGPYRGPPESEAAM